MNKSVKQSMMRRIKIISGQIEGLRRMVEKDAYCIDIITQSSAIRHALSALEDVMLENHLQEHAQHQLRGDESKRAITEILTVYKLAKKK